MHLVQRFNKTRELIRQSIRVTSFVILDALNPDNHELGRRCTLPLILDGPLPPNPNPVVKKLLPKQLNSHQL